MNELKKFPNYTEHGLGISKSGRLQVPIKGSAPQSGENWYGQPLTNIGQKIAMVSHNGMITKKNIGELVAIDFIGDVKTSLEAELTQFPDPFVIVKHLDGVTKDGEWLYCGYTLTDDEYNDALKHLGVEQNNS